MLIALAILLGHVTPSSDTRFNEKYDMGAQWAAHGVSDECANEIEGIPEQNAISAKRRNHAAYRAQILAGTLADLVTKAKHDQKSAIQDASTVAGMMADYPACNFFRLYPAVPAVVKAREMLTPKY